MGKQNCSYNCLKFVLDSTQPVIWSDLIYSRRSDFGLAWHLDQTMTTYILIFIHTVLLTWLHDLWDVLYYEAHHFPCWNYHWCGPQLMRVQPCCTWLTSDRSCSYCSLTLRSLGLLSGPKPCLVSATFSLWLYWIIQQHSSSLLIQRRKSVSDCVRVSACVGVCVCQPYPSICLLILYVVRVCRNTVCMRSFPLAVYVCVCYVCVCVRVCSLQWASDTASVCRNLSSQLSGCVLAFSPCCILVFPATNCCSPFTRQLFYTEIYAAK